MVSRKSPSSKESTIFEGKYLRLIDQGGWEFSQRTNCTGIVVIIAMTEDKRVVLIRQFRPPVGRQCIEFPAGLVNDQGKKARESLVTAAKRELLEETGYRAKRMLKIMEGPVSPGSSRDVMTLYRAEGLTRIHGGGGDHQEDIEVCEIPLSEVEDWLRRAEARGSMVDPKVYAGLYFLSR